MKKRRLENLTDEELQSIEKLYTDQYNHYEKKLQTTLRREELIKKHLQVLRAQACQVEDSVKEVLKEKCFRKYGTGLIIDDSKWITDTLPASQGLMSDIDIQRDFYQEEIEEHPIIQQIDKDQYIPHGFTFKTNDGHFNLHCRRIDEGEGFDNKREWFISANEIDKEDNAIYANRFDTDSLKTALSLFEEFLEESGYFEKQIEYMAEQTYAYKHD